MRNGSLEGTGRAKPRAVAGGQRAPELGGTARSVLRGELDNVGLPTLLTIFEMERRSGLLIIDRDRTTGRLWVRDGRVIRARIEGKRPAQNVDAVCDMLGWGEGQFEMWQIGQASVLGGDEIGEPTTYLLMEAARRSDEARGVSADDGGGAAADFTL